MASIKITRHESNEWTVTRASDGAHLGDLTRDHQRRFSLVHGDVADRDKPMIWTFTGTASSAVKGWDQVGGTFHEAKRAILDILEDIEEANAPEPKIDPEVPHVDGPATLTIWTDSIACTVERVSASGKTAWIREDKATIVSGSAHDGSARYSYERNPDGALYKVTRRTRRNGTVTWKRAGVRTSDSGWVASFGARRRNHDPHF